MLPFRLLAITPPAPTAVLDTDAGARALVEAWLRAGAGALGIAVLLRDPQRSARAVLGAQHPLAPLRRALAQRELPVLLSVGPNELDELDGLDELDELDGPDSLEALGLSGVQLRGDPERSTLAQVRARLGPGALVGRSCHGAPARDALARARLADYTCLAPIFTPRTLQPGITKVAAGLDTIGPWLPASREGQAPVLALGGVTPGNAGACLARGAHGVAGISLFFGELGRVEHNVRDLRSVFDHASPTRP